MGTPCCQCDGPSITSNPPQPIILTEFYGAVPFQAGGTVEALQFEVYAKTSPVEDPEVALQLELLQQLLL